MSFSVAKMRPGGPCLGMTHRLTGHDRIFPVRPHIEIDDLVPVLGLVERAIRPEARSRLELEIERLIPRRATAVELGRCAAAVAVAPDEELVAVASPATGEVGLAVGQTRRRSVGSEHRRFLVAPIHRQGLRGAHVRGHGHDDVDAARFRHDRVHVAHDLAVAALRHFAGAYRLRSDSADCCSRRNRCK